MWCGWRQKFLKSETVSFSSLVRGTWAILIDKSSEREENDYDGALCRISQNKEQLSLQKNVSSERPRDIKPWILFIRRAKGVLCFKMFIIMFLIACIILIFLKAFYALCCNTYC